ncbi:tRNA lysidine(34) synthetase TilS [Rhodoflexus sp.]
MQVQIAFERKLQHFIADNQLFTSNDRLLLAVSGGIDSMVMSQAMSRLGYAVTIAHVNYQLRGDESDADEHFVCRWAADKGITCLVRRFETKKVAQAAKKGIQATARQLRYDWFEELRQEHGFTHLLTAHHCGDALETTLYHLAKGSGLNGLRGIPLRQGYVVRPLLAFTREEIRAYANSTGLVWREDSSNVSDDYARNFIRHRVVPLLEEINPSLVANFATTHERLADASQWLQAAVAEAARNLTHQVDGLIYLDIKGLQSLPSPRLFLYEYLKKFGFNYKTVVLIAQRLQSVGSGTQFYAPNYCATIDRESIIISSALATDMPLVTIADWGIYMLDHWRTINIRLGQREDIVFGDPYCVYVDAEALQFPLYARRWQAGDFMQPLGMTGRKKVSDILIDLKVPRPEKQRAYVLCNVDGQILWLIGYRLSAIGRITDATQSVAMLEVSK